MSVDHHKLEGSGSRQPAGPPRVESAVQPAVQPIRGITRLVNPPEDNQEVISPQEDPVERGYLGRILHVADRVLGRAKTDS